MASGVRTSLQLAFAAGVALASELIGQSARADLAIRAASWVDVDAGRLRGPSVFLIRGTLISDIVAPESFRAADAERTVDLGSATLLPGLIDGHVHLQIGGPVSANAASTLEAGFTTAADLGATTDEVIRFGERVAAGSERGPRLLAAGLWAGTKGGVCEFGGIGIAEGAAGFRQRVRDNVRAGAALSKVCVSSWPRQALITPERYEITDESLTAFVDESHRLGRPVIGHAIGIGAVRAAVDSGVDGLAHVSFVNQTLIAMMRSKRVFMISTLASLLPGTPEEGRGALAASLLAAHQGGVRIVFGTDAGVLPHGRNAREFAALIDAGLQPIDAIRAATINAAAAFRLGNIGRLRPGHVADIVAVQGDPLRDPASLSRLAFVMKDGRIVDGAGQPDRKRP